MTEEKHIDAYLGDIQLVFLGKKISSQPLSWGQFLDNSNEDSQVGLYGTVAGTVALKASNRNGSPDAIAAEQQLVAYWTDRANPHKSDNLCQNIRLASLLLGLSFLSSNNSQIVGEIADELTKRVINHSGLWSDSSSPINMSPRSSEFSSAMVLILAFASVHFFKGDKATFAQLDQASECAARALQKRYLDDRNRERPYVMALLVAVVLVLGEKANFSVQKKLSEYAWGRENIFQRYWQYIDYIDHQGNYTRDYFILPIRLLMPLLLMRGDLKGTHFLGAKAALAEIKATLDSNNLGLFVEQAGRPSSLEQALVILGMEASRQEQGFNPYLIIPKLWIGLKKPRSQEWAFAWFFLVGVYLPIGLIVSSDWILNAYNTSLWADGIKLLEAAETLPKWTPSLLLLFSSALRKPNELLSAAFGRSAKK